MWEPWDLNSDWGVGGGGGGGKGSLIHGTKCTMIFLMQKNPVDTNDLLIRLAVLRGDQCIASEKLGQSNSLIVVYGNLCSNVSIVDGAKFVSSSKTRSLQIAIYNGVHSVLYTVYSHHTLVHNLYTSVRGDFTHVKFGTAIQWAPLNSAPG